MIRDKYPLLYQHLSFCTFENGLDVEQIRGIVANAKSAKPEFIGEINAALADDALSWRAIFDDPEIGEIYVTESEESALQYARLIFCD